MGKAFTIYSENPKMNTAELPKTPGYAAGGIVMGDDMMELMERPPATVTEALVRRAAEAQRQQEAMRMAKEQEAKRRRKSEDM
jgi:uncharacterized protein (DUF2384 family)